MIVLIILFEAVKWVAAVSTIIVIGHSCYEIFKP